MSLKVSFDIPPEVLTQLIDGALTRCGGVIQDPSGRVVMWLRELGAASLTPGTQIQIPNLESLPNLDAISFENFAAVAKQFNKIEETLNISTAASFLNLGISAMGFTIIAKRVQALEQQLEKTQQLLQQIDSKIEISFAANFQTALDLAINSFTMSKVDNRRDSALNAINRFLEAEHIYAKCVDKAFEQTGQIAEDYLLMLCLSYISEARCYLELEEFETAIRRFQQGKEAVTSRMEKYIDHLLTSNPLMYLHPELKGETSLSRLTQIYRWKNPKFNENSVFELLRDQLIPDTNSWDGYIDNWIKSLLGTTTEKQATEKQVEDKKGFWGGIKSLSGSVIETSQNILSGSKEARTEAIKGLVKMMETMESMVETHRRFVAYEFEMKAVSKLGMSFSSWLQLRPLDFNSNSAGDIVYILPDRPIEV